MEHDNRPTEEEFEGKIRAQPETPHPGPGKGFLVVLGAVAGIANLATAVFFDFMFRQATLLYQPIHVPDPDALFTWITDQFISTIAFGCFENLFIILGVPAAAVVLLSRHVGVEVSTWKALGAAAVGAVATCFCWFATAHFVGFLLLAAVCAVILFRSERKPLLKKEWVAVTYMEIVFVYLAGSMIVGHMIGREIDRAYERAISRGTIIAEALKEYKEASGDYPENLEELTPDYLAEIPGTEMAAFPEFSYSRDSEISDQYILSVHMYDGSRMNWKDLWYWPEQDYDDPNKPKSYLMYGKSRIDGWLMTWGGT